MVWHGLAWRQNAALVCKIDEVLRIQEGNAACSENVLQCFAAALIPQQPCLALFHIYLWWEMRFFATHTDFFDLRMRTEPIPHDAVCVVCPGGGRARPRFILSVPRDDLTPNRALTRRRQGSLVLYLKTQSLK